MDNTKLNRILDDLRTDVNDLLTKSYTTSEVSLDALQDQLSTLSTNFYSLESEMTSLVASINTNAKNITALTQQSENTQIRLNELQTNHTTFTEMFATHLLDFSTYAQKVDNQHIICHQTQQTALDNFNALKEFFEVFLTETEINSATTNVERITALKTYFANLKTHLATYSSDYFNSLTEQITTLETTLNTLQNSYQTLSQTVSSIYDSVETAQQTLNSLENTQTKLVSQCENLDGRVELLEEKVNYLQNQNSGTDPDYSPIPYEQEQSDRIKQTYAKFSRKFLYHTYGSISTSPKAYFYAEKECSGSIKVTFRVNINAFTTINKNIYLNDEIVYTETSNCEVQEMQTYTFTADNITFVQGTNQIYSTIARSITSIQTAEFVEIEVIAPNVEVLNQFCPYHVDSFNGKYYITDCSGENAKMAIIDATKMISVDNLAWTDLGVKANFYRRAFGCSYNGEELTQTAFVDVYQYDETLKFLDEEGNQIYSTANYLEADWLPQQTEIVEFLTLYKGGSTEIFDFENGELTARDQVGKNLCYCAGAKNGEKYAVTKPKNYYGIGNMKDGTCCLLSNYGYGTKSFPIGIGSNGTIYLDYIKVYNCDATCYYKYFDKMIRTKLNTKTTEITILSTYEIGPYEKYFDGINNDYFVVKNGKLKYFKKPSNE